MSRIIIVRHGDTFAPGATVRRIGAGTDLPLVAGGRDQARRLREAFDARGVRFDRAQTGPLLRTRQTAEIMLAERSVPAETAEWLDEIDHGPDEGAVESDVVARIGHAAIEAWDRAAVPPSDWVVDAAWRTAAWRAALDRQAGREGTLLVVTSNGAARFALTHPDLQPAAARLGSVKLRTGAYGSLAHDAGWWRLAEWNVRP